MLELIGPVGHAILVPLCATALPAACKLRPDNLAASKVEVLHLGFQEVLNEEQQQGGWCDY